MYTPPKKRGPRSAPIKFAGKMRLRVGDTVRVLTGKDKNKEGKIVRVLPTEAKVVIEGINIMIKHQKATQQNQEGKRLEIAAPMHASKVQLVVDASGGKTGTSRIGIKTDADGNRVRFAKKTGSVIANG